MNNKKLFAILGPTSSGKSRMAIELAKQLDDSAIVNCDSRQIYQGLNIGTGKVEGSWNNQNIFVFENQPHYLIDYINPSQKYSLTRYLKDFNSLMSILTKTNIILVGGTGLYADSILNNYQIPNLPPKLEEVFNQNKELLEKLPLDKLQKIFLEKPKHNLNQSDFNNPRRLINSILKSDPQFASNQTLPIPSFQSKLLFAIDTDKEELHKKIEQRLNTRFQKGLIDEIKKLNLPSQRLQELGLEYRLVDDYLHGKISKEELLPKMLTKNLQYAKRQLTWLKKRNPILIKDIGDITISLGI